MKKFFSNVSSIMLVVTVSIAAAPVTAYAAADFTSPVNLTEEEYAAMLEQCMSRETVLTQDGQFGYQVERDPHLCAVVREYHGTGGDVYVPDVLDRLRISYSYLDFARRDDIDSVTYGGTANMLGIWGSYANCTNLESFAVNSGYSDALMESYFPGGEIPYESRGSVSVYSSFENCSNLKSVQLPEITMNMHNHIAEYVFKNCTALPEITLNGYWNVDEGAFLGCTALTKAVFNENIQSIGDYALGYVENEDGTFSRYDGLTIYGISGTAAETYALENDIPFVDISVSGDITGDGTVSVSDVVLLSRYLTGQVTITESRMQLADLSGDGKINAVDLTMLKRIVIS